VAWTNHILRAEACKYSIVIIHATSLIADIYFLVIYNTIAYVLNVIQFMQTYEYLAVQKYFTWEVHNLLKDIRVLQKEMLQLDSKFFV
jgi:hypothetical protein